MKWPIELMLIRHDISAYNILKKKRLETALYQRFLTAYKKNPTTKTARDLARRVEKEFALGVSDYDTPLAHGPERARRLGAHFQVIKQPIPDVIFVSPYARTQETLLGIIEGYPELDTVPVVEEERIREQEHGLALLYNDWKVFFTLFPEQRALYEQEGSYSYRWPQGENVPDVRSRSRSFFGMLIREYAGKRVWAVTHHLNILSTRANLERWTREQFLHADHHQKPDNCSVTTYRGDPNKGKKGKLICESFNQNHF